jgi:hypothetical protein
MRFNSGFKGLTVGRALAACVWDVMAIKNGKNLIFRDPFLSLYFKCNTGVTSKDLSFRVWHHRCVKIIWNGDGQIHNIILYITATCFGYLNVVIIKLYTEL